MPDKIADSWTKLKFKRNYEFFISLVMASSLFILVIFVGVRLFTFFAGKTESKLTCFTVNVSSSEKKTLKKLPVSRNVLF